MDIMEFSKEKVTKNNCVKLCNELADKEYEGGTRGGAWRTVYQWCGENGMRRSNKSGILSVISFLENLKSKTKK